MDESENDALAFMPFPRAHWAQIHSTNPLERRNAEIKRRTNVVGIFPNDASIVRLVGAMMLEQNDEWSSTGAICSLRGCRPSAILRRLGCPLWLAEYPCNSAFSGLWIYTTGWDTTAWSRGTNCRWTMAAPQLASGDRSCCQVGV